MIEVKEYREVWELNLELLPSQSSRKACNERRKTLCALNKRQSGKRDVNIWAKDYLEICPLVVHTSCSMLDNLNVFYHFLFLGTLYLIHLKIWNTNKNKKITHI